MNDRTPYDGKPYYCQTCTAGFGEYINCDSPLCELETKQQAEARLGSGPFLPLKGQLTYGIFCKRTGEQIATVKHKDNSGSCRCLSADRCEARTTAFAPALRSTPPADGNRT